MTTTATATLETVRQQIETAFPFSVDRLPLSGPDGLRTPHYGLFRSDNGDSVGNAVRRGYTPHTTDDVAALCEAAAESFDGIPVQVSTAWRDGHNVVVAPTRDYRRECYDAGDTVWPRLIVSAGYGGSAFSATLGLYRDACRNLQIVRSAGFNYSRKIRHTAHLRTKMPALISTFRQLAGGWDNVCETVAAMQRREVQLGDFIAEVYPLPGDASRRTVESHRQRCRKIVQRIARERQQLGRGLGNLEIASAWEAFQGVQGYVQHDQRRHGRPSPIDRALMALDDAAVARAQQLALAS